MGVHFKGIPAKNPEQNLDGSGEYILDYSKELLDTVAVILCVFACQLQMLALIEGQLSHSSLINGAALSVRKNVAHIGLWTKRIANTSTNLDIW